MINGLRLELRDVGPIFDANIDINRINVVGGQNATGKSTASKLLYCFLKVNSSDREKLVAPALVDKLLKFYNTLVYIIYDEEEVSKDLLSETVVVRNKLLSETVEVRNQISDRNYDDFGDVVKWFKSLEFSFNEYKTLVLNKQPDKASDPEFKRLTNYFESIKEIVNSVNEGSADFFQEVMLDLLSSELETDSSPLSFNSARLYDSLKNKFSFEVYFMEDSCDAKGKFNVTNVFYLESFSIFDNLDSQAIYLYRDPEHVRDLKEHLFPKKRISKMYDDKSIKKLEAMVTNLVGGRIIKKGDTLRFVPLDSDYDAPMKKTASGIKQIAVIQTLLHNRFLYDGCVLIIDEPEVNLHPEWQIKLARILVRLAKDGNITVYINTHSPMFIEAIDTFAEYYDFEEYANYYLTEKIEGPGNGFNFKKIHSDELYKIYDNLGDPYDYLDRVRLSKGRKEGDKGLDF